MNHDITFCISLVCPSRDTCRRAFSPSDVVVSQQDFYQSGPMCGMYWPIYVRTR